MIVLLTTSENDDEVDADADANYGDYEDDVDADDADANVDGDGDAAAADANNGGDDDATGGWKLASEREVTGGLAFGYPWLSYGPVLCFGLLCCSSQW